MLCCNCFKKPQKVHCYTAIPSLALSNSAASAYINVYVYINLYAIKKTVNPVCSASIQPLGIQEHIRSVPSYQP